LGDRFSLRPALLYQTQASASEVVVGNEFHYNLNANVENVNFVPAVFLGGWYRTGDATMVTAGFEYANFRVGVSYDYNISTLNAASNGNGGFEIGIRYIAPYPASHTGTRTIPCNRF